MAINSVTHLWRLKIYGGWGRGRGCSRLPSPPLPSHPSREMACDQLRASRSRREARASPAGTRNKKESFIQYRNHLLLQSYRHQGNMVRTAVSSHCPPLSFPRGPWQSRVAKARHLRGTSAGGHWCQAHLPTVWPWARNLSSLSLSFCVCLMEVIRRSPGVLCWLDAAASSGLRRAVLGTSVHRGSQTACGMPLLQLLLPRAPPPNQLPSFFY